MSSPRPASRSVYRGQSRIGVGEGPDQPVLYGEQYMHVDRELFEVEMLDAMRSWMSLDSDPLDHQRLKERLESWSVFSVRDRLCVVRLVPAGIYDQRAAYFSHARVWKRPILPRTFDPGLNLGHAEAFARTWRDPDPVPVEAFDTQSSVVRPQQIRDEAGTAALFLAYLYQTIVQQNALIITAPVEHFVSGSALHALVSFARGGLPADVRDECRIRVYSRSPDKFLRQLRAHLVVIPEQTLASAIAARPTATLLDRRGDKVRGNDLDPRFLEYANWVVERATALPDGLSHFSERYAFRPHEFARAENARASVQITYNVAYAMPDEEGRRALVTQYLPLAASLFGPGLEWSRFIRDDEWNDFPADLLIDHVLTDREPQSDGERELLRTIETTASRLNLTADRRLAGWWSATDPAKVRRVVELLTHTPPLISDAAAAERTIGVPLDQLARFGSLDRVLRAEVQSEWIRDRQDAALAAYATRPEVFSVLRDAVAAGHLGTEWAEIFVRTASAEGITPAAEIWLADANFRRAWGSVPRLLLDRLRSLQPVPASLRTVVADGCGLHPAADLRLYVRLADLLARIDEAEQRDADGRLIARLLERASELPEDDRAFLESVVFDPAWRCLRLDTLPLADVLQLALLFRKEESFTAFHGEIDRRMRREPEATTAALVKAGWWYFWRSRSRLSARDRSDAEALQRSASEWLRSSRRNVTMEAWQLALNDLPRQLSGDDLARLREQSADGAAWPLIPPFEQHQVGDLAERAADLGALAEIAEAVTGDRLPRPVHEYVLSRSRFETQLPPAALSWLIMTPNRHATPMQPLTLSESAMLYQRAGHRSAQALDARARAVAHALHANPLQALDAAERPRLWQNDRFLNEVAQWIAGKGSVEAAGQEALKIIERNLHTGTERRQSVPAEFIRTLVQRRWSRIAHLLDAEAARHFSRDVLTQSVFDALLQKRANDPCWQTFVESVRRAQADKTLHPRLHPLRVLAAHITSAGPSLDQRNILARDGWQTFEKIARQHRVLVAPPPSDHLGLPVFDFAASMLGPGALGIAAIRIRELADPAWREDVSWWRRLLASLRGFRRYGTARCGDDREALALTCILGSLAAAPNEHRALVTAMSAEAKTNRKWTPLAEFGMEAL